MQTKHANKTKWKFLELVIKAHWASR